MWRHPASKRLLSKTQEIHRMDVAGDLTLIRHIPEPLDDCNVVLVHPFNVRFGRFNSLLNCSAAATVFDVLMRESFELQKNENETKKLLRISFFIFIRPYLFQFIARIYSFCGQINNWVQIGYHRSDTATKKKIKTEQFARESLHSLIFQLLPIFSYKMEDNRMTQHISRHRMEHPEHIVLPYSKFIR